MELEQVFMHFAERMQRKGGIQEPEAVAERQADAKAASNAGPNAVPIDGRAWSDDERDRVEQALAALRATRLGSQVPPHQRAQALPAIREVPKTAPAPDAPVSVPMATQARPTPEFAIPRQPAVEPVRWYGPGESVDVAGYRLPGLVRVARSDFDANRAGRVAVVAGLLVDAESDLPDFASELVSAQGATYSMLTPNGRAHFLAWLAADSPGDAPLGFAYLRFLMLEGRVLDATVGGLQQSERLALKVAIESLIEHFGEKSWHLREYGRRLADILGVPECSPKSYLQPPPPVAATYEPPVPVHLAMGQAAHHKEALPAAWALTALTSDINTPKRVPLTRCAPEFAALFAARFQSAFPDGLRLRASRHPLRLNYRPLGFGASATQPERLDAVVPGACVTDFTPAQRSTLSDLLSRCADELSDYSRHLGKIPDARGTPEAQLKLPAPLLQQALRDGFQMLKATSEGSAGTVTLRVAADALWGPGTAVPAKVVPALKALLAREGFVVVTSPKSTQTTKTAEVELPQPPRVRLDKERLQRVQLDAAEASSLLAALFKHEEEPAAAGRLAVMHEAEPHRFAAMLPSLDLPHLQLLDALLERDHWTRHEVEDLARSSELMVDGALEHLNEAALEAFGDFLLTADGDVEVHTAVAAELRR